uniref:Uncharacterized protein n=1 Tax=Anguilla anguilla TaxID=7936 RepID=A0A0E9X735_ANGAN
MVRLLHVILPISFIAIPRPARPSFFSADCCEDCILLQESLENFCVEQMSDIPVHKSLFLVNCSCMMHLTESHIRLTALCFVTVRLDLMILGPCIYSYTDFARVITNFKIRFV